MLIVKKLGSSREKAYLIPAIPTRPQFIILDRTLLENKPLFFSLVLNLAFVAGMVWLQLCGR